MQRLPNVHPSNTALYPNGIGMFNVGAANEGSKILFYNGTQLTLQLDFLNGTTDTLHPWEANWWLLVGDTKQIQWAIDTDSLNVTTPPISAVFLTLYGAQEKISGTYPVSLPYQTSLGGGQTNTNVSSTNTLSNETNTSPTLIIDIGQVANTNLINVFSDGSFTWTILISGVTHTIMKGSITGNPLQLGKSGDISEILGNLTVDGTSIHTGVSTFTGGTKSSSYNDSSGNDGMVITAGTVTRIQNATQVGLQVPGGTTVLSTVSTGVNITGALAVTGGTTLQSGVTVTGNSVFFTAGSISRISTGTYTSSTAAKSINHGLGGTPTNVLITGGTNTFTATAGAGVYGATTFSAIDGAASVTQLFRAERT